MWFNEKYKLKGEGGRHTASQVYYIEDVFTEYFSVAKTPSRIIELGTDNGSFTNVVYNVRKKIDGVFDFYTFDIKEKPVDLGEGIIFRNLDILKNINVIGSLITENTLVLCDNGNKIQEVWGLSPYLKSGCVIMAHDYFYDAPTFYIESSWPVCEICFNDIRPLLASYGLQQYHSEIMDKGLWLSLIKI